VYGNIKETGRALFTKKTEMCSGKGRGNLQNLQECHIRSTRKPKEEGKMYRLHTQGRRDTLSENVLGYKIVGTTHNSKRRQKVA